MGIRNTTKEDAEAIGFLLDDLGYPCTENFVADKLTTMLYHPDQQLLVYELGDRVVGFMSIHFVPQIALTGDFAIISYFAVDEDIRSRGIGKQMEEYCVKLARERNCDRIQVHCNIKRIEAHRFYERQGYIESRKYFSKKLTPISIP